MLHLLKKLKLYTKLGPGRVDKPKNQRRSQDFLVKMGGVVYYRTGVSTAFH